MTSRGRLKAFGAVFLALLVVASGAGLVAAQDETYDDPSQVNYDDDAAPNPMIETTVTVDRVQPDWSPTTYEGDDGGLSELPAALNDSVPNPVTLTATDIDVPEFAEFPRTDTESDTWTNASQWSSDSSASVTETTTAPNVEAVNFATDGSMTAGDSASATYADAVSIHSDEEKRHLQVAADVNTLNADSHVEIRVTDADGDYVKVVADPDNSTDADHVLASSTGDGYVSQVQMGQLAVEGSGDGDFNDIESVDVVAEDGEADITFSLLNAEKLGAYDFGTQMVDEDGDGEKNTEQTVREPNGAYGVTDLGTLGGTFSDAEIRNVEYEMTFAAHHLSDSEDGLAEFVTADDYPGYDWIGTYSYRLELPTAYDLSYSNSELRFEAGLPEERYHSVEIAEAVGDTEFANVSGWTDYTDQIATGETVTLDNTISAGESIAFQSEQRMTDDEKESSLGGSSSGGAMGPTSGSGGGGGGLMSFVFSIPGMVIATLGGLGGYKLIWG